MAGHQAASGAELGRLLVRDAPGAAQRGRCGEPLWLRLCKYGRGRILEETEEGIRRDSHPGGDTDRRVVGHLFALPPLPPGEGWGEGPLPTPYPTAADNSTLAVCHILRVPLPAACPRARRGPHRARDSLSPPARGSPRLCW